VVAQNKLLLQGMSLQVLLSHQPPEVIERWKKVKQMQVMLLVLVLVG